MTTEQLYESAVGGDATLAALRLAGADAQTSVDKALALLCGFTHDQPVMGLTELASAVSLPKSTAFRLLAVLGEWGFVERVGKSYTPGFRLALLSGMVPGSAHRALRDAALPFLQDLYELTHETVHLAVPDGTDVLYVEKIYGHNQVRSPSKVGGRLPANCSALGKAMLAFSDGAVFRKVVRSLRPLTPHTIVSPNVLVAELQSIREKGLAFDHEEATLGLRCVAAPILAQNGTAIASVSVSGPTPRFDPASAALAVRRAAAGIARSLQD